MPTQHRYYTRKYNVGYTWVNNGVLTLIAWAHAASLVGNQLLWHGTMPLNIRQRDTDILITQSRLQGRERCVQKPEKSSVSTRILLPVYNREICNETLCQYICICLVHHSHNPTLAHIRTFVSKITQIRERMKPCSQTPQWLSTVPHF